MSTTDARSNGHILKALAGLLLALFVSTLSSTVVATALPQMMHSLHGSPTQYTWVVTATLLTATAATPIWGKLADLFSKKLLIQVAAAIFIAGSVAAGCRGTPESSSPPARCRVSAWAGCSRWCRSPWPR